MNEYEVLGNFYDFLNSDMDYPGLAEYIVSLFDRYAPQTDLVLDLGCGTGTLTLELLKRGYDMIGLDRSPVMLQRAVEKTQEYRDRALFIGQDMLDFELYGTVDAIVATMDVVNHLVYKEEVKRLFRLCYHYLNYGGLFIFDINTPYKLKQILGNEVYVSEENGIFYIWENSPGERKETQDLRFTFFVEEDGKYERYEEAFTERAYEIPYLEKQLEAVGFTLAGAFHDRTFQKPKPGSQRVFFVAKKVDK